MAKSLIITEKPSVAQEFARILGVSGRNDGYIENSDYVITWCVGHLVEMVYPEVYDEKYKKWKLEDLPFLPKEYKYDVIPAVSKQYDVVHKMLHREDIDTVYWAGDAGKEGQTIEENIRMYGGVREGMKELRVWIDSQTEEEIKRGIREAKPMSDYANLGKSGIMRTIEDYAMGINFSRAMSVKYGNLLNDAAGTRNYTAIAVGRVMTCVLGMVVIREREIRNFVETPFYRVVGSFTDANIEAEWKVVEGSKYFESPLLYKENGFKKQESAENLIQELSGKTAVVESEFKLNFKQLLTPGIILIFVGIFIYLFDIQLPSVLMDTINSVGSLTAPLSMMMIGSSLAVYPIKDSFTDWRSYVFAFVRLMIVPFVTMIMCRLLHIDAYYANITIITNAMPVGSMVLMLATQYNANVKIVTRNIVVSTLLSVITIPIVVATMLL